MVKRLRWSGGYGGQEAMVVGRSFRVFRAVRGRPELLTPVEHDLPRLARVERPIRFYRLIDRVPVGHDVIQRYFIPLNELDHVVVGVNRID